MVGGPHLLFLSKQTEITAGNSRGSFDQRSQKEEMWPAILNFPTRLISGHFQLVNIISGGV